MPLPSLLPSIYCLGLVLIMQELFEKWFCSLKITNSIWEMNHKQQRDSRFCCFSLPMCYVKTGCKSSLPAIFWWMGLCSAEFADLVLQVLTRVLTDGWTLISSNWWCQLGIFTFLSFRVEDKCCGELDFFLSVAFVSFCDESLRGQCVPLE